MHLGSATFGHRSAWQRRQAGFSRAYLVRRYGLLRRPRRAPHRGHGGGWSRAATRVLSRDLAALRGRVAGWRAAAGLPRRPLPPAEVLDHDIGLRRAFALRRAVYAGDAR